MKSSSNIRGYMANEELNEAHLIHKKCRIELG